MIPQKKKKKKKKKKMKQNKKKQNKKKKKKKNNNKKKALKIVREFMLPVREMPENFLSESMYEPWYYRT